MTAPVHFKPARAIAERTPLARPASIGDLLGELVRVASPVVLDMLKSAAAGAIAAGTTARKSAAAPAGAPAAGGAPAPGTGAGSPLEMVTQVLRSILGGTAAPGTATSHPASLAIPMGDGNRFDGGSRFVRPFVFGVDDMLIASLAGPILNVLPQLVNAANQKRIQLRQADNRLMGGILSDVNKRLMMDKLIEAQEGAQAQGPAAPISAEQIQAVADLLAQMPEPPPPPPPAPAPVSIVFPQPGFPSATATPAASPAPASTPAPAPAPAPAAAAPAPAAGAVSAGPAVARPHSLGLAESPSHKLSERAMLDFSFAAPVEWNGTPKPVFDKSKTLRLRPRLVVSGPAPKQPLPKAILKVVLHDVDNPDVRLEKTFKLKNLLSNAAIECAFEAGELAHLPPNACFTVLGELRWRNPKSGRETQALGSSELVLVGKSFIKNRGPEVSAERELTDMTVYRPFWNKIWEAPTLDGARGNGDNKKYSWELDVNAKYTVVLSAANVSNGIMETKVLKEVDQPDSLSLAVRGRIKGGIELSLGELNKLIVLWAGPPALDATSLEALQARPFLQSAARELRYHFKLKGRAGQGGMVWVIPAFKLFGLTLSTVTAADESGQVTTTSEADVQFPLPVSARLIGLKSAA